MEDDKHHSYVIRKESSRTRPQAGKDSSPHNTHTQGKDPTHERESPVSEHKEQHHHHPSAQPETTTVTAATSSMISKTTNYNVNVQFDPATPQAGKPTILSLIVTEQKIGEPIKQFDIIHDKLMHLIMINREDLSHFAHIHPKLNKETSVFHIAHTFSKAGKYKMWIDVKPKGGIQVLTTFAFNVEGKPVHTPANITSDKTFVKEVVTDIQRYKVTLDLQRENLVLVGMSQ
jgi:hypothetical protein